MRQRTIPISYAKRIRGGIAAAGTSTHLPSRQSNGCDPNYFAVSLIILPNVSRILDEDGDQSGQWQVSPRARTISSKISGFTDYSAFSRGLSSPISTSAVILTRMKIAEKLAEAKVVMCRVYDRGRRRWNTYRKSWGMIAS